MNSRWYAGGTTILLALMLALSSRSVGSVSAIAERASEPMPARRAHRPSAHPDLTVYVPLVAHGVRLQPAWLEVGRLEPPAWPDVSPFPWVHVVTDGRIAYGLTATYVADGAGIHLVGSLTLVDTADPTAPRWLGQSETFPLGGSLYPRFYTVVGTGRAYVTAGTVGLQVLDVADPTRPKPLATIPAERGVTAVQVNGTTAYVADSCAVGSPCPAGGDGTVGHLRILDLADPARPRELGLLGLAEPVADLALEAGHVFVAGGASGVLAVDVADVSQPRVVATYADLPWAGRVTARGPYLYTLHYQPPPLHEPPTLTRLDVSDVARPVVRDQLTLRTEPGYVGPADDDLKLGGDVLLVVRRSNAIDWFDVADAHAPLVHDVFWSPKQWVYPSAAMSGGTMLVAARDLRFFRLTPAGVPQP